MYSIAKCNPVLPQVQFRQMNGEIMKTTATDMGINRRDVLRMASTTLAAGILLPGSSQGTPLENNPAEAEIRLERPVLFPAPQEMKLLEGAFKVDAEAFLLLPATASASDLHLSRALSHELSDWFDLKLRLQHRDKIPADGRFIVMGSIANPLIREQCARLQLPVTSRDPGPEGYLLHIDARMILIAGCDDRGAFYGMQSLRQLIQKSGSGIQVPALEVRDWPAKPFRGVKLYLPGRSNIPFFKRFIRDFMAQNKYNTLMMEMNACMRLDRHPELNAGWVEFSRDTNYSRRNYPPGVPHEMEVNSSHQDTADGGFLEKDEVADLVRWVEQNHIEVVPEVPSLTHGFYLLSKHRELAQTPGMKWPDTYCACDPRSYQLLFEVMDEYIEVMKPKMIHAGHDEWFAAYGLGPCCQGKDPGEVYGEDLRKVHAYLAKKGIRMAIWGDYLLEGVRGKGLQKRKAPDGYAYSAPGAMTLDQVKQMVPKDILIFNWFWNEAEEGAKARIHEKQLEDLGFQQVYGNMTPSVSNYPERSQRKTLIGGAPSSWAATTEFNMGKDLVRDILGCSSLLWSKKPIGDGELSGITQTLIPDIRLKLSGQLPPSETGDKIVPIDISSSFNGQLQGREFGFDMEGLRTGKLTAGNKIFELTTPSSNKGIIMVGAEGNEPNPLPHEVTGIKIGVDATSLIFLHACAKPATNKEAYRLIWDFDDSADLLGWYEVVYEDGFPEVLPIRYGVNILEWNWARQKSAKTYCYGADVLSCGCDPKNPITLFAFEWNSTRLGKIIREVRLKGTTRFRGAVAGFENAFGEVIPNNAILLKAISFVEKRG
jgi:hypothetical protein